MATVLTISPAVATEGELVAEKTAARSAEAGLTARCNSLVTDLTALTARVAALEAAGTTAVTNPLPVTDLAFAAPTVTSLTVTFTEVGDGTGHPASYVLRYAAGTLQWATGIQVLIPGTRIGATVNFLVGGLAPGTAHQAQVVAYRGTLDLNAIFGPFSAVASGTTLATTGGGGGSTSGAVIFASEWPVVGLGTTTGSGAPRDTWDWYAEFNNNSNVTLMSVVPGAGLGLPVPGNALKVVQAGDPPGYAANCQKNGVITPGVDYWVRYYFRNDDTSPAGDHCTTCDYQYYGNLTYLRKMGGPTSWAYVKSFYGTGYVYPIGHWFLKDRLANGAWYRLEDWVHWTSPTTIQVHPRVYDATGALLYQDADFQQSDFLQSGNLSFKGRADWTLATYYAAGYDFGVVPQYVANFAVGNNGQQGSSPTGLPWYYARVEISTAAWIGA